MDTDEDYGYEDDDLYDDELWWCPRCDEYVDPDYNLFGRPRCPSCKDEVQGVF